MEIQSNLSPNSIFLRQLWHTEVALCWRLDEITFNRIYSHAPHILSQGYRQWRRRGCREDDLSEVYNRTVPLSHRPTQICTQEGFIIGLSVVVMARELLGALSPKVVTALQRRTTRERRMSTWRRLSPTTVAVTQDTAWRSTLRRDFSTHTSASMLHGLPQPSARHGPSAATNNSIPRRNYRRYQRS